jgi:uncharacterized membrane protein
MGSNQFYKNKALASLDGKWSTAIIATLIYLVLGMGISWTITTPMGDNLTMSYSTSGIWTLICLPLGWGFTVYFLRLIRNEELGYGHLFDGYKDFVRIFVTELLIMIATAIGFCLLIIPGFIICAGLLMTPFIMKDDEQIGYIDAMKKSWELTNGHKADLIWLFLSFIGWIILAGLTFCIGFLFLYPYMQSALAHVYEDLKAEKPEVFQII